MEKKTILVFTTPRYNQLHAQMSVLEKTFIETSDGLKTGVTGQLMVDTIF